MRLTTAIPAIKNMLLKSYCVQIWKLVCKTWLTQHQSSDTEGVYDDLTHGLN